MAFYKDPLTPRFQLRALHRLSTSSFSSPSSVDVIMQAPADPTDSFLSFLPRNRPLLLAKGNQLDTNSRVSVPGSARDQNFRSSNLSLAFSPNKLHPCPRGKWKRRSSQIKLSSANELLKTMGNCCKPFLQPLGKESIQTQSSSRS